MSFESHYNNRIIFYIKVYALDYIFILSSFIMAEISTHELKQDNIQNEEKQIVKQNDIQNEEKQIVKQENIQNEERPVAIISEDHLYQVGFIYERSVVIII